MKKILFGIMLIFLSMNMIFLSEFQDIILIDENFDAILCAILPIVGCAISIWGLFEKDK